MLNEGVLYSIYEKYMDDASLLSMPTPPVQRTNNNRRGTHRFNNPNGTIGAIGTGTSTQDGQVENNNEGGIEGSSSSTATTSSNTTTPTTQSTNNDYTVPFFGTGILIFFHFFVERVQRYLRYINKQKHGNQKRCEDTNAIVNITSGTITRDIESNGTGAYAHSSSSSSQTLFRRLRRTVCERGSRQTIHTHSTHGSNTSDDTEHIALSPSSSSTTTAVSSTSFHPNSSNNSPSRSNNDTSSDMRSTSSNHQAGCRSSGFAIFLHGCMRIFMTLGIFLLIVLYLFNHTYIGLKKTSDKASSATFHSNICLQSVLSTYHDTTTSGTLLNDDEILQIIVLLDDPENYCKTYECSKVWNVGNSQSSHSPPYSAFASSMEQTLSSPRVWEKPFYRFAHDAGLLSLSASEKKRQKIKDINVTVTPHCLSTGHDLARHPSLTTRMAEMFLSFFSGFVIYDTILINELMHGLKTKDGEYRDGHLMNDFGPAEWSWSSEKLSQIYFPPTTMELIWRKIKTVLWSLTCFFFITSCTAILTQSVTSFLDCIVKMSKGSVLNMVKNPIFLAHITKFIITYWMFQASKDSLKTTINENQEDILYYMLSFFITVDVFRLIFIRSALSIAFFPRIVLVYFLCFNIYINSTPFGFFHLATMAWHFFIVHAMSFCILAFEVPAFLRGRVSIDHPRELHSRIEQNDWNIHDFSSEWSLFFPLNSRYVPIEDRDE